MKRLHIFLGLLLLVAVLAGTDAIRRNSLHGPVFAKAVVLEQSHGSRADLTLLSHGYRLDRIYRSMEGPSSSQPGLRFASANSKDIVWLTGLETEIVDAKSRGRISQEFFCHSNLTFDSEGGTPTDHNTRLQGKVRLDWRLFTLVPGRLSLQLPEGFGIPVPANAALDYYTMTLNQNVKDRITDVRMHTRIRAVPGSEPNAPKKALFRRAIYVLVPQTEGANFSSATTMSAPKHVGAGCADFCSVNISAAPTVGSSGEGQTLHWLVPPGRHTYRTEITPQLTLPFDTTIHYATFHVHPFATSFLLRDLTTDEVVLDLKSRDWPDRLGVAHVDEVKSIEGLPIHRDHRYEIVTEYDNTSGTATDAMGILYLYLLEKEFTPELTQVSREGSDQYVRNR